MFRFFSRRYGMLPVSKVLGIVLAGAGVALLIWALPPRFWLVLLAGGFLWAAFRLLKNPYG